MNADKALSGKTILVVEDEAFLRRLIIEVLNELDVQIVALPSADAGYDLLEKKAGEIALLVTDIRMPGRLDGVDLANIVCKKWPHINVVLTSGYDGERLVKLNQPAPFLHKPWTIDALQDAVVKALIKSQEKTSDDQP
jgi:DNA-binding NtrC family response regulator